MTYEFGWGMLVGAPIGIAIGWVIGHFINRWIDRRMRRDFIEEDVSSQMAQGQYKPVAYGRRKDGSIGPLEDDE